MKFAIELKQTVVKTKRITIDADDISHAHVKALNLAKSCKFTWDNLPVDEYDVQVASVMHIGTPHAIYIDGKLAGILIGDGTASAIVETMADTEYKVDAITIPAGDAIVNTIFEADVHLAIDPDPEMEIDLNQIKLRSE